MIPFSTLFWTNKYFFFLFQLRKNSWNKLVKLSKRSKQCIWIVWRLQIIDRENILAVQVINLVKQVEESSFDNFLMNSFPVIMLGSNAKLSWKYCPTFLILSAINKSAVAQ